LLSILSFPKVRIESRAEQQKRLESKIATALGDAHMLLDNLDDL
jgi:predicted component of type VI protein secretion system